LFPLDLDRVLKKMKTYSDPEPDNKLPPYSELFFQTPKTIQHSLELSEALTKRINYKLSSPIRKHMELY
jgi:hypothetical protein